MKIMRFFPIICFFLVAALYAMHVTESMITRAEREMTPKERVGITDRIKQDITAAKFASDNVRQAKLEEILDELSKNHYADVMQKMRALGYNPEQTVPTMTRLRDRMLSGGLEQVPWVVREIAAIDLFFFKDIQENTKRWPQQTDKIKYLIGLVSRVEKNNAEILDSSLLEEVIDDLEWRLDMFKQEMPLVLTKEVHKALIKLKKIRASRIS
jgi:hypothetical protein